MQDDDAYLLDLCDDALGEDSEREHRLAWNDDPVDAWYPALHVVVMVQHPGYEGYRRTELPRRPPGIEVVTLPVSVFERDAAGALRRTPRDAEIVAERLRDVVPHLLDDAEDPDAPEVELAGAIALGWRGRSIALAVLEAVKLSRRALAAEHAGRGLSPEALEALLVLYVGDQIPREPEELEVPLGRPEWEIRDMLAELRDAGLITSGAEAMADQGVQPGVDHPWEWTLTPAGNEWAVAWVASLLPLFRDWPPDARGVDDAGGFSDGS